MIKIYNRALFLLVVACIGFVSLLGCFCCRGKKSGYMLPQSLCPLATLGQSPQPSQSVANN